MNRFSKMPLTARERRNSLLVLGIFWFFTGVEYAVTLPSAWRYLQNLGAKDQIWLSISISSFSVATFIFSPVYGKFADRYSTKTILIISNVFEIVGNLLYFLANDVYTNVESRFIAGMGAAAGSAIFAYVGRASATPMDLNKNMGAIMTARAIGLILGPAFNFFLIKINWRVGNFLIDPYNSPGLLMTFIWIACQFLVIKYFKDVPREDIEKPVTISTDENTAKQSAPSLQTAHDNLEAAYGLPGDTSTDTVKLDTKHIENSKTQKKKISIPADIDDTDSTPKCSEYLGLGVIALLLVQFLNMFNQMAYETMVTPFTQDVFEWNQVANSIVYMLTAVLAISVYIGISHLQ